MSSHLDVWEEIAPSASRSLDPEHREVLEISSQISPEIIDRRGYHSLSKLQVTHLVSRGIVGPSVLKAESWMAIPIWRPDEQNHGQIIRMFGGDSPYKYVWPTGLRLCLDVHPDSLDLLYDTDAPVFITEGIKKADAVLSASIAEDFPLLVIAVNGCDGWRNKIGESEEGEENPQPRSSIASPDFLDIAWGGRRVFINSDSDYRTNNRVSSGWNGCATYLSSKTGEHRTLLVVTPPAGMEKQGADDWLAGGGTLRDLLGFAQTPERAISDQSGQRRPFRLKTGLELIEEAGDKIPHLIYPLIPDRSITLIAGHSGTYKTWNALGLGLDSAFGFPWLSHPSLVFESDPFTTLYINKEMSGMILGQRLKTLTLDEKYKSIPGYKETVASHLIFPIEPEFDLNKPDDRDRLEDAVMATGAKLVILDSLSMSWHGDENSASEVGEFYSVLRGIIERTGCSFALLHHLLKPPGGRVKKGEPVSQFSVRGSGQLYQQADACVMMFLYSSGTAMEDNDEKLVTMHHVKARTSLELPSWVARFSTNDGLFTSVQYLCKLSEARATAYAESGGDAKKIEEWILEECFAMPAMAPGPGTPGFRTKQLTLMLQQAWTVPGKPAPSESTIHRHIGKLVEDGKLVMTEQNKRIGGLYKVAEATVYDPGQDTDTEAVDPSETT
jgi:hypothetical protein